MSKEDSILLDYFKYTKLYQSKYGENTIVFMQVGAFFEVYALKHPIKGSYEITKIVDFTETCNLNIAEKKMSVGSNSQGEFVPFPQIDESLKEVTVTKLVSQWLKAIPECKVVMAGVRDYQIEKYIHKMTEHGFTVVVYVQEKTERGTIQRKLYHIYSPGTFLGYDEDNTSSLSNHIMCIWIEKITKKSFMFGDDRFKENLICGVSTLNIFTGESFMFEYETPFFMNPTSFDELERTIATMYPKEIILISTDLEMDTLETILKYIGISYSTAVHFLVLGPDGTEEKIQRAWNCTKQTYVRQILGRVYQTPEFYDTCSEFAEHAIATQSYCYLLDFVNEHNPDLLKKVHVPKFSNVSNRMILANHTLKQLNIIHDDSNEARSMGSLGSVSKFLNKCCTAMGRRKFHDQITHPVFVIEWLENEYSHIDRMIQDFGKERLVEIRAELRSKIRDVEKMLRKLVTGRIYPSVIVALYETVQQIVHIHDTWVHDKNWLGEYCGGMDIIDDARSFLDFLVTRLQIDTCRGVSSMTTYENNIICPGVCPELDACITKKKVIAEVVEEIRLKLGQAIVAGGGGSEERGTKSRQDTTDFIRIHETEKSGISFQTTKKRSAILKAMVKQYGSECVVEVGDVRILWKDLQISNASTNYDEIEFDYLSKQTRELHTMGEYINGLIGSVYVRILKEMEESWYRQIESIAAFIARLDVLVSKAYIATEYHYCRPSIVGNIQGEEKAYVSARNLRHCLIEHLQQNEIYVTNDVDLGCNNQDGILLYGTNAVGKTSIIRALGIAVIMAQSGCYVPCSEFVYWPYKAIFSRILGNDNIFKGMSTFAVEMSELRMILKMADADSLILGDELCSGTEIDSALSIFVSGLIELNQKQSSFIFATHFHEILEFSEIQEMSGIAVKHMSVVYDYEKECLVYDRKIKDGPGNRMYGLEVCKSLFLPHTFLKRAYEIRGKYFADVKGELGCPVSRYNTKKVVGVCEMCGLSMSEEVHHLNWQKDADQDGFIGHFHKNHPANLLSVCSKCHETFHHKSEKDKGKNGRSVKKKTTNGYKII